MLVHIIIIIIIIIIAAIIGNFNLYLLIYLLIN